MELPGYSGPPSLRTTVPGLQVTKSGGVVKDRKLYQIANLGFSNGWTVHNSSIDNLSRAVVERIFYVKSGGGFVKPPVPVAFGKRLAEFRNSVVKRVERTAPMGRLEFANQYRGRLLTIYTEAVGSLMNNRVTVRDSHIKAFVKAERVNTIDKPCPVARVIQPRSPRYNVEVGRYVKPIEHKLYRAVAEVFKEKTVFKCMNAFESGMEMRKKWLRYADPVAIGLDASRFDQHVSLEALEYEHTFYNRIYGSYELASLLRWQLVNHGAGYAPDGKLKYTVVGKRMSGDMNTGLGNCLLMCSMMYHYRKQLGRHFSLANNGDDCVCIMERGDVLSFCAGVPQYFRQLGFTMVVEKPVDVFERIEFCQTQPIRLPDRDGAERWVMVRKVQRAISKDCLSLVPMDTQGGCMKQLTALGECGLSLCSGIPVMQSFYSMMLRSGKGKRGKYNPMNGGYAVYVSDGVSRKRVPVDDITRYSFYLAFGIEPSMQAGLEDYYDGVTIDPMLQDVTGDLQLPPWI